MADQRTQYKQIDFSGKLRTCEPVVVGADFRTLKNMRYADGHVRMVQGMTKINTVALTTYLKTRNAFHFRKAQPAESHVLVQAYNTDLTASQVLENTTAIPSAGAFSATALHTDSAGAGRGFFSDAPDGHVVYCNGIDACIWGGNESKIGAMVVSSAAVTDTGAATSPRDYTEIANNTKADGGNVIPIGGGIDTYTVLMLHCDGAAGGDIVDSETAGAAKAVTAYNGAAIVNDEAKFGTGSIYFDGVDDYIGVADSDDFTFGTDPFTIDFQVKFKTLPSAGNAAALWGQYTDATNWCVLYVYNDPTYGYFFQFDVDIAGSVINVFLGKGYYPTLTTGLWYHIALIRGFNSDPSLFVITVNGESIGATVDGLSMANQSVHTFGKATYAGTSSYANCYMDEIRISKGVARWTAIFTAPTVPYMTASRVWLLGSPRPLRGMKYYVSSGNTVASTMTGKVWNGSTWATLTITDNTTDTGASLAQTGTVTFPSTVGTAKPKYLEGYFLYWYQFEIDAGEAEISHITMDAPFQNIVDMWDGVFRDVVRFYEYKTAYVDYTLNVLKDDYDASTASTYYDVGGLDAWSSPNNAVEIGFTEKQTGLQIKMAVPNAVASTAMTVEYWNGSEYSEVGTLTDGTSEGAISLKKTGVVSWNNNSLANEMKKVVSNSPPLYFYRLRWNQNITDGARINYIGGISAQKTINYFKFPVFAQGRVLLCADMAGDKNKALVSPKFMPQVYNGADSVEIWFGEDGELTCGVELFSQFGSSLYSLVLMFKDHETWVMAGADIEQWQDNTYLLSSSIGCPAPQTLKSINLAAEPGAGVNRSLAIWQGANGIYMSDGRAPIPIHGDIKEYFDRTDTRCIKASMVGDSVGWIDPDKNEYHWLFASGTAATTLNTELVYDIARNRWFEIDRTADLQCGVLVYDTDGNPYTYGFLDTGYMERLEYGNTFDEGVSITGTVHFGDMALAGLQTETRVENVRLFTVAKTTTGNEVTCTHYAGTGTVETAVASRGLLTVNSPPTLGDQFTIDTTTFTIVTTRSATGQVTFSANVNTQASNIATAINADMTTVTASASTNKVTVTAATAGSAGNLIVFASSAAKISANGSGLLGGTTEGADASAIAKTMSPARTGYRVAIPEFQDKLDGDPFHSFKFVMSTADETIGFEPLSMVLAYHATHQD